MLPLRSIVGHRTRSASEAVRASRDASVGTFCNSSEYPLSHPAAKQDAADKVIRYVAASGIETAGAETALIMGPFHKGGFGTDRFRRLTVVIEDKDGERLYFYRTTDRTFWDEIHIPYDTALWPSQAIYRSVTKTQFETNEL